MKTQIICSTFYPILDGKATNVYPGAINKGATQFPFVWDLADISPELSGRVELGLDIYQFTQNFVTQMRSEDQYVEMLKVAGISTSLVPYYQIFSPEDMQNKTSGELEAQFVRPLRESLDYFCEPFRLLPPYSCTNTTKIKPAWFSSFGAAVKNGEFLYTMLIVAIVALAGRTHPVTNSNLEKGLLDDGHDGKEKTQTPSHETDGHGRNIEARRKPGRLGYATR